MAAGGGRLAAGRPERQRLSDETSDLRNKSARTGRISQARRAGAADGRGAALVAQVAPSDTTVLMRGETGTGKELIARASTTTRRARDKPFVTVNCGALPENLVESELFGHERGAFTGAQRIEAGPLRGGQRRHAVPRRDRRADARRCRSSCCACSRSASSSGSAARQTSRSTCASSPPPTATSRRLIAAGRVPRGPLLPAQRVPDQPAAAARAQGRHPAARRPLPRALRAASTARTCARIATPRHRAC